MSASYRTRLGFFLFLFFVIGIFSLPPIAKHITPITGAIVLPFVHVRRALDIWIGELRNSPKHREGQLLARISEYEERIAKLRTVEDENTTLRKQLAFLQSQPLRFAVARVISRDTNPLRKILVLDRGSEQGIQLGYPVITDHGVMIGKIGAVEPQRSKVVLLTDKKSKVIGQIIGSTATTGVIEGQFGLGLVMNLIPISDPIEKQSLVVTSSGYDSTPDGLVIGTVTDPKRTATDLFQSAVIYPSVNYDRVRVVSILLPE